MYNKKVSIVLTSYNNPKYLPRAIESVLNQTYDNFELIIADDNSSDKEVIDIIQGYVGHGKAIAFNSNIKEEDRLKTARYATQINTGVTHFCTGDYLMYLADDDYFYPTMLEKMMSYVDKTNHDVVFCAQHVKDIDDNIDGGGIDGRGVRFFNEPLLRGADKLDHNQVMTSRVAYDAVNGWNDEAWCWSGADAVFYDRLENAGYVFYPIDTSEPLQAKMYRENSVQWNMTNGLSPVGEEILNAN
jgi:glycosyltransferase involved in cell wall biosynthesis